MQSEIHELEAPLETMRKLWFSLDGLKYGLTRSIRMGTLRKKRTGGNTPATSTAFEI